MRVRAVVAVVLLFVPAAVSAQRLPRVRRPPVTSPQPLPDRRPPEVARELSYVRMHVSFEEYPIVSYIDASAFDAGGGHWTTFGMGSRADYRLTPLVSATADVTSSVFGSPVVAQTFELGTRLHRQRTESRAYSFADFRLGWMWAYDAPYSNLEDLFTPARPGNGYHHSRGIGAVAGLGTEYALTRRFSLTAAASIMHTRMVGYSTLTTQPSRQVYPLNSYRFVLGLRFNPVRLISQQEFPSNSAH